MALADLPLRRIGSTAMVACLGLGFGAVHLGELYGLVPEAQSQATLQAAWDVGVRFYDTAPWYRCGLSEHRLGAFLRGQKRAAFQVTTKVGRTLHRPSDPQNFDRSPWLGGLNFEVQFDYSRDGILRSYEQALQRIALDTVDALVIHDLDAGFHGERQGHNQAQLESSGLAALQELKAAGDIKAYGMGINNNAALEQVAARFDLDFCLVALPYTLLDHASLHRGMVDLQRRGISAIIGAPFASGILVTGSAEPQHYAYGKAPPDIQTKVRVMERVCAAHGVALPAVALQFVLAHPVVASAIPGGVRPEEVVANAGHVQARVPLALWADLKAEGLIDSAAPVPE